MIRRAIAVVWWGVSWFLAALADAVDPAENYGERPRVERFRQGTWRPTWKWARQPPKRRLTWWEWLGGEEPPEEF